MADLNGEKTTKGKQGANLLAGGDSISGLIIETPEASGLLHSVVKEIYNPKDAEALGIDTAFDTANDIVAYRHITEFYRMADNGTKLFIMLVPQDTGLVNIFADSDTAPSRKLAIKAKGEIRQLAAAVNPTSAGVILNGLTTDCYNGIPLAQGFGLWAYEKHMPQQVLLEGREYSGPAASVANLRDIPDLSATKVSVCIGQDWNYAESRTEALNKKFADVGTLLGTVAKSKVNQNAGEHESFDLTDATKDIWMEPALSNHVLNDDQESDLQTLEDKGYIFGLEYVGMAGTRWNNDHVCAPIIIDAEGNMNEHTISLGRTVDKAVRLLRTAYLPKVKTNQPVDTETGLLPSAVVTYFDGIGNTVLGDMQNREEISKGVANTDPNSDLLIEKVLKIDYRIQPRGTIGFIDGTINIKKSIN
ncbi:MAG: hypothetical protein JXR60_12245 [Bacteroidales bacterium]|nr:hypothetical protein [Bacteroidales bacterium]